MRIRKIIITVLVLLAASPALAQTRFPKAYQHANTLYTDGVQTLTGTYTSGTFSGPTISGTIVGTYTIGGTPTFPAAVTFGTSVTSPLNIGGTAASSTLSLRSTSGVGTSDAIIFQVGNNGGTEFGRIVSGGSLLVGTTVSISSGSGNIQIGNAKTIKFVNGAGTDSFTALAAGTDNSLRLGDGSQLSVRLDAASGVYIFGTTPPTGGTSPVVLCIDSSNQIRKGASATSCT